jgi:hypothetical protein
MRDREDEIPIQGYHRNVPLHDEQDERRLEVVRAEIDYVLDRLHDRRELYRYLLDVTKAPEARILAGTKIEAAHALAAEERRVRPNDCDMDVVRAEITGLRSRHWRSPRHYGCILDVRPAPGEPGPVERETPIGRWRPAPSPTPLPRGRH